MRASAPLQTSTFSLRLIELPGGLCILNRSGAATPSPAEARHLRPSRAPFYQPRACGPDGLGLRGGESPYRCVVRLVGDFQAWSLDLALIGVDLVALGSMRSAILMRSLACSSLRLKTDNLMSS